MGIRSEAMAEIELRGLVRSLGGREILHGLDLDVEPGEWFGLVGPNGSGKSTTLDVLTTMREPSGGTGRVAGHDLRDVAAVREIGRAHV